MAGTENTITVVGTAGGDPELRFTPNGTAVANFSLASTPRVKDGDSWKDGETTWLRVNVWRDYAEHVADSISKGMRVVVIGRLKIRAYETTEGQPRQSVEIEADEVAPSLKWATAKVEKTSGGKRASQGQDTKPERTGDFNEPPPF